VDGAYIRRWRMTLDICTYSVHITRPLGPILAEMNGSGPSRERAFDRRLGFRTAAPSTASVRTPPMEDRRVIEECARRGYVSVATCREVRRIPNRTPTSLARGLRGCCGPPLGPGV